MWSSRWQREHWHFRNQWTKLDGKGQLNSHDHYIHYCRQEPPWRNGVALIIDKSTWNAALGCNLKNERKILVPIQGKSSNIRVIQFHAPTTNAKEAELEWFYEELQDLLELTWKDVLFIIGDWNFNVGSQEIPGTTDKFGLGVQNAEGQRLTEFCQENILVIANILFQQCKRWLYS